MATVWQFETFWKETSLPCWGSIFPNINPNRTHTLILNLIKRGGNSSNDSLRTVTGGLRCLPTGSVVTLHHYLAAFSRNQNQTEDIFDTNTLWWCVTLRHSCSWIRTVPPPHQRLLCVLQNTMRSSICIYPTPSCAAATIHYSNHKQMSWAFFFISLSNNMWT